MTPPPSRTYGARFAGVAYPGETLKVNVWKDDGRFLAGVVRAARENAVVLSGVELIPAWRLSSDPIDSHAVAGPHVDDRDGVTGTVVVVNCGARLEDWVGLGSANTRQPLPSTPEGRTAT